MLGFPKDNSPIKGDFANEAKKWITAVDHYNQGIATEEEIKLIEDKNIKIRNLPKNVACGMLFIQKILLSISFLKKQNDNNGKK